MGAGGFILGGALQGIGAGLVAQGQANAQAAAKAAEQDGMMRREIALENLRSANRTKEAETGSALKQNETETQARWQDWGKARDTSRSTDSTVKIEGVKTGNQIKVEQVKAANDRALANLQSSNRISEAQAGQAAELSADLARMGKEVGEFKVNAAGQMVAYSKTGQVLRVSQKGMFRDPEDKAEGAMPGFPGASPAPAPAAPPPGNRPPLSSFNR